MVTKVVRLQIKDWSRAWRPTPFRRAMRIALVNPTHALSDGPETADLAFDSANATPLEFDYARALLERNGCKVLMLDALSQRLTNGELAEMTAEFAPDLTAVAVCCDIAEDEDAAQGFLDALAGDGGVGVTLAVFEDLPPAPVIEQAPRAPGARTWRPVLAALSSAQRLARRSRLKARGARSSPPNLRVIPGGLLADHLHSQPFSDQGGLGLALDLDGDLVADQPAAG